MPLYLYTCKTCGDDSDWRSIIACMQPLACPQCGNASERAVTAPTILGMDALRRKAYERNEESAHAPKVVRAQDWKPHDHHTGHQLGKAHAHGPHVHQSSRPWMIGH
jgi:putative FmdB family regulatory protein